MAKPTPVRAPLERGKHHEETDHPRKEPGEEDAMTWIVKATGGYEYNCHPDGDVYGPDLSDAYRYEDRTKAARVAAKLNRLMLDGKPYRVVRLKRPRDHVRAAANALLDELNVSAQPRKIQLAMGALAKALIGWPS